MLTKRIQRNIVRRLARRFDVTITLTKNLEYDACVSIESRTIELHPRTASTKGRFVGAILHEVAHLWMWDMGIYRTFHRPRAYEYMTIRELQTYLATAWKAERKAEEIACGWLKELYPQQMYWYAYGWLGKDKKWINETYTLEVRRILRKKQLRKIDKEKRNEQSK